MYNKKAVILFNGNKYFCPVNNGSLSIKSFIANGSVCQDDVAIPLDKSPEIIKIAGAQMSVITFMKTENAVVFCCDSRLVENNNLMKDIQRYYYDTSRGIIAVFSGSNIIRCGTKEIKVLDFLAKFIDDIEKKQTQFGIHPLETINMNGRFALDYPDYDFGDTTVVIAFNSLSRIAVLNGVGISNIIPYNEINEVFYEYGDLLIAGRSVYRECDIKNNSSSVDNAINFSKSYLKALGDIYSVLRRELRWNKISPVGGQVHSIVLYNDGKIELNGKSISVI